jgi:indole-3-glycerol phosphate synthase
MTNRLEPIQLQKQKEVDALRELVAQDAQHPIMKFLRGENHVTHSTTFKQALNKPGSIAVIAEIKRKSPSKGLIAPIIDPVKLAHTYAAGGADALSILTDTHFFNGHLDDLTQVARQLQTRPLPILRKDFIIDKIQIAEAAAAHAHAVLFIVAVLGQETQVFLEYARSINMDVLIEVHDRDELELALHCGAEIIGINNRDLKTFEVDTKRASELIKHIPDSIVTVAESGILDPQQVHHYYHDGFNAVLIGEALVKSDNPALFIKSCHHA